MTSNKKLALAIAALIMFMIGCKLIKLNPSHRPDTHTANGKSKITTPDDADTSPESAKEMLVQLDKDASLPLEQKNRRYYLRQSMKVMAALFYKEMGLREVTALMRDTQIEPYMVQSEHKGLHIMVRAKRSWPAVRYLEANFHGQSYEELDLSYFSFHYQPGKGSFLDVQTELIEAFGPLGSPIYEDKESRTWALPEGYEVGIRYLSEDEIELGDIYNAYTEADRGSLVITVYKPTDDHEDHDH